MDTRRIALFSGMVVLSMWLLGAPLAAQAQSTGEVDWGGWQFDYEVSSRFDGVSLKSVYYQGVKVLHRASMPVMTVFYDNNACGPYADRLGGAGLPVEWAGNTSVVNRTFTQNGENWREIGFQDKIGAYILYQVWYLSESGQIEAHIFAKGLQCSTNHLHYPFWRLDFDLAGAGADQIRRHGGSDWHLYTEEFDAAATEAHNHQWQVSDIGTGVTVDVAFDDNTWNVQGTVIPETLYSRSRVYGRRYHSSEAGDWTDGAITSVQGNNDENINGQDIILWYRSYLPHLAEEGGELWHATGIRLTVNTSNQGPFVTSPGPQTNIEGERVHLVIEASDPNGDVLTYSAIGLPDGLTLAEDTGVITGVLSPGSTGTYSVTVEASDGNRTGTIVFAWTVSDTQHTLWQDDFEVAQGWSTNPAGTDSATTGHWERANPEGTVGRNGTVLQLDTAASGQWALVTKGAAGSSVGTYDIDGGETSMRSPDIALPEGQAISFSLKYYLAHLSNATSDDYLRVKIVGTTTETIFEELGAGNDDAGEWSTVSIDISHFAGQTIYVLIEAADGGSPSLVEAGIDDVEIRAIPRGNQTLWQYDFESTQGWSTNPSGTDTATTGHWERANPEGTVSSNGTVLQLDTAASGQFALVTEGAAGRNGGTYDIDAGQTSMRSPDITLPGGQAISFSLKYYLAHLRNATSDDYLRVKIVGTTTETIFEELGAGNDDAGEWSTVSIDISHFAGQTIYLLIEAADGGSPSLVEAGIDDVEIRAVASGS